MSPVFDLHAAIADLLASDEPVSFYDAVHLLRQLRGDPSDLILMGLVALHDSDYATDGSRAVLAEYLRGAAVRLDNQRLRAARPLTVRDDGKTARAAVGSTLELHLEERRGAGYRWEVAPVPGAQLRRSDRHSGRDTAVFLLHLQRPGTVVARLIERPPPAAESAGPARAFQLTVVVEEAAKAPTGKGTGNE